MLHGCTIGDDCLIGMGAIVMDRAVIESGVMIGAGGLVPPGRHCVQVTSTGSRYASHVHSASAKGLLCPIPAAHYVELARRHQRAPEGVDPDVSHQATTWWRPHRRRAVSAAHHLVHHQALGTGVQRDPLLRSNNRPVDGIRPPGLVLGHLDLT